MASRTDCVSIVCCHFGHIVVCTDPISRQLRFPFSSGGLVPTLYRVMVVFWSYLGSRALHQQLGNHPGHILHRTGKPLSLLFPDTLTPQSLIIHASCLPLHAIPPKRCWPQVAREPFFLPGYALSRAAYDPITPASSSLHALASTISLFGCVQFFPRLSSRYSA